MPSILQRSFGARLFLAAIALLTLHACAACRAQDVIVVCNQPVVATHAIAATRPSNAASLWLALNPNSGPGSVVDRPYQAAWINAGLKHCNRAAYIDFIAGPKNSPIISRKDGKWLLVVPATARDKTVMEIRAERDAWIALYGQPDAWFLDDLRTRHRSLIAEVLTWKGSPIWNYGTSTSDPPARGILVIHEDETPFDRALKPWEAANRQRCCVIGLAVRDIAKFITRTNGLGMRFASPLSDADGAYDQPSLYLTRLLP